MRTRPLLLLWGLSLESGCMLSPFFFCGLLWRCKVISDISVRGRCDSASSQRRLPRPELTKDWIRACAGMTTLVVQKNTSSRRRPGPGLYKNVFTSGRQDRRYALLGSVAGARMVGMGMGDHGTGRRTPGVDVKRRRRNTGRARYVPAGA